MCVLNIDTDISICQAELNIEFDGPKLLKIMEDKLSMATVSALREAATQVPLLSDRYHASLNSARDSRLSPPIQHDLMPNAKVVSKWLAPEAACNAQGRTDTRSMNNC